MFLQLARATRVWSMACWRHTLTTSAQHSKSRHRVEWYHDICRILEYRIRLDYFEIFRVSVLRARDKYSAKISNSKKTEIRQNVKQTNPWSHPGEPWPSQIVWAWLTRDLQPVPLRRPLPMEPEIKNKVHSRETTARTKVFKYFKACPVVSEQFAAHTAHNNANVTNTNTIIGSVCRST